ncbi:AzlD domain-containing protein [Enterococcus faecalis]|uniref:AzlD domain-containing protein n=1 Tax=Enterococcus faecalis TaxID=1351 RepID=UPI003D0F5170
MFFSEYIIFTILGCSLATLLSRVAPFLLLKKLNLPRSVLEYLNFVPIVIMTALWISSLFEQRIGKLPELNLPYLLASLPTILSAILTRNLLIIVLVGLVSFAIIQNYL